VILAGHLLRRTLEASGISVDGGVDVSWNAGEALADGCVTGWVTGCSSARKVAFIRSPPLSEIVWGILEPSQNWMTEQLVRTLGDRFGSGGGWDEGLEVVEDVLTRVAGVDSLDLSLRDGSGLSAYNLVTPRAVVRVLDFMARSEHAGVFRRALAAPGEEGSTLERRLVDLEGRVQAKTGTISHVNALSGYLERDDGTLVYFSVLTNGSGLPSGTVRDGIDRVVKALAGYPSSTARVAR
jgi:D-alanyl-D-alanine carboxypeptidase/D-alanyl-D-alanine-endopeptidase (penicillin-binding protein 4)